MPASMPDGLVGRGPAADRGEQPAVRGDQQHIGLGVATVDRQDRRHRRTLGRTRRRHAACAVERVQAHQARGPPSRMRRDAAQGSAASVTSGHVWSSTMVSSPAPAQPIDDRGPDRIRGRPPPSRGCRCPSRTGARYPSADPGSDQPGSSAPRPNGSRNQGRGSTPVDLPDGRLRGPDVGRQPPRRSATGAGRGSGNGCP